MWVCSLVCVCGWVSRNMSDWVEESLAHGWPSFRCVCGERGEFVDREREYGQETRERREGDRQTDRQTDLTD